MDSSRHILVADDDRNDFLLVQLAFQRAALPVRLTHVLDGQQTIDYLTGGRLRPPVGWAAVAGGGTIAGIGFTVSILIATLAFHGGLLEEAKLGVLSAALVSSTATWTLAGPYSRLPAGATFPPS